MPEEQIFSAKSTVLVTEDRNKALVLLCLLNSRSLRWFLYQQGAGLSGNTGKIKKLPIVWPSEGLQAEFVDRANDAIAVIARLESYNETSPLFVKCAYKNIPELRDQYRDLVQEMDSSVALLYSHEVGDDAVKPSADLASGAVSEAAGGSDARAYAHGSVSYMMGVVFGRWNAEHALSETDSQNAFDPFEALPAIPPGCSLPNGATSTAHNGLEVSDGILVDDESSGSDVVKRIRSVIDLLWQETADTIESEACVELSTASLRDYLRDAGARGYFITHVTRYSRSRRKVANLLATAILKEELRTLALLPPVR